MGNKATALAILAITAEIWTGANVGRRKIVFVNLATNPAF
jgi:hypothetical protein